MVDKWTGNRLSYSFSRHFQKSSILGPAAVVKMRSETRYYVRSDNPLKHLPWQPKPYLLYGHRLGDAEEVAQGSYQLLKNVPEAVITIPATDPSWKAVLLQSAEQITAYFCAHPDALNEQAEAGQSCWLELTKRSRVFLLCLTKLIDETEKNLSLTKENLRDSLCLSDENERGLLHAYFDEHAAVEDNFSNLVRDLPMIYEQLSRLDTLSLWDQQRDMRGWLPFEIMYQAWQKNKNVPLNVVLSLWFLKSHQVSLEQLCSAYPLAMLLRKLTFTAPLISPVFSLYANNQKEYLLSLLSEDNQLNERDEKGNNLLHWVVKENDGDFFRALMLRVNLQAIIKMLGQTNLEGDVPIVLATKQRNVDVLWCMVQHNDLLACVHSSWNIIQAKQQAQGDTGLLAVLAAFSLEPKQDLWSNFFGYSGSRNSDCLHDIATGP